MTEAATERQQQVLEMLKAGVPTAEIAKKLGISDNGVYQHKRRLVQKGLLPANHSGTTTNQGAEAAISQLTQDAEKAVKAVDAELAELQKQKDSLTTQLRGVEEREAQLTENRKALIAVEETIGGSGTT